MNILCQVAACLSLCFAMALMASEVQEAPASPWPLDIPQDKGVITLYQPQPEKLEGNQLSCRAAASYLETGKAEDDRIFGALWFVATLDIDREHDVAKARSLKITKVVTPKGEKTTDDGAAVKKTIEEAVIAKGIEMDLDRLIATLEDPGTTGDAEFNAAPPRMKFSHEPAVLVVLDGEPQMRDMDGVKRAVNSPAFLAIDAGGSWWLRGSSDWLTAKVIEGPWEIPTASPDKTMVEAAKKAGYATEIARMSGAKAPKVFLAKVPTELVVFDGKPAFEPIGDGALLAATNTDTTVLVEVATGKQYLLLAGRWFRAEALLETAAWELVKPDELPEAFAAIPATSEWQHVRSNIAGTPEAEEATIQQQIPQTARIPRTSTITVIYDGEPVWVKVDKLEVEYAKNTADAVFRLAGPLYFACRDGVWYESKDPKAAFTVATSVPEALRHLPPDCPWHNCSYVTVYETTTEYVWCGYTPGYLGWYSWCGCPIYGTGYPYPGWYGPRPVPYPITWGIGIHYNPWTGWGVSVGVGGPHWSIGISTGGGYGGGWYGSGGCNNINIDNSNNINIGNGNGNGIGNRPSSRPAIYDRVPGAERPKLEESANRLRGGTKPVATTGAKRENLAVDRDGTIARPAADGSWQTREAGGWKDQPKPAQPVAKPADRPAAKLPDVPTAKPAQPRPTPQARPAPTPQQTQQMRSRGEQRVQQRSQPAARSTGGGGGGGRRR